MLCLSVSPGQSAGEEEHDSPHGMIFASETRPSYAPSNMVQEREREGGRKRERETDRQSEGEDKR